MNSSHKTSALVLAAGFMLTAATAFPQSSSSTSSSQDYAPPQASLTAGSPLNKGIPAEQFPADTDYDGRISFDEFIASPVVSAGAGTTARSSTSGTPRSDEATKVGADAKGRNTPELFRQLDKDKDGFLSSSEIAAFYRGGGTP